MQNWITRRCQRWDKIVRVSRLEPCFVEWKNVCGMVSKIVVEWRFLEAPDWSNIQVSEVQRRRARIQLNITSQEEEDESSMIDWRKKRRRIGWSRTKSDRRVYEEQEMWRDRECWTGKKMEWFEMTDIKEKIAWIWWKMRQFVSVFMFVCVCCESETEKGEQNCEKNSWWAITGEKVLLENCRWNQKWNDGWEIYKYLQIDEKTKVNKK